MMSLNSSGRRVDLLNPEGDEQHSSTPTANVEQHSSAPTANVEQHSSTPTANIEQHSSAQTADEVAQPRRFIDAEHAHMGRLPSGLHLNNVYPQREGLRYGDSVNAFEPLYYLPPSPHLHPRRRSWDRLDTMEPAEYLPPGIRRSIEPHVPIRPSQRHHVDPTPSSRWTTRPHTRTSESVTPERPNDESRYNPSTIPATPGLTSRFNSRDTSSSVSTPEAERGTDFRFYAYPPPDFARGQQMPALMHRKPKKEFPCPKREEFNCQQTFTTSGHAARHAKTVHTTVKDIPCQYCDKKFSRRDNMLQHCNSIHANENNSNTRKPRKRAKTASMSPQEARLSDPGQMPPGPMGFPPLPSGGYGPSNYRQPPSNYYNPHMERPIQLPPLASSSRLRALADVADLQPQAQRSPASGGHGSTIDAQHVDHNTLDPALRPQRPPAPRRHDSVQDVHQRSTPPAPKRG